MILASLTLLAMSDEVEPPLNSLEGQMRGFEYWRSKIEECKNLPPEEAIPALGTGVRKMSLKYIFWHEERWKVQAELREALFAIPGHAEWYRDDIMRRYNWWERTEKPAMNANWSDFTRYRGWNFETLKEMPSPETVRVLGEMLGTEEDGYGHGAESDPKLRYRAAAALCQLGVENPPSPPRIEELWTRAKDYDLKAWRLWYGQVKAGNRTFRFEGDPQVYDLNGPVREVRDPSQRPRQSGPSSPAESDGETRRRSFPWVPVSIACAVLALAFGSWLRGRRKQLVS